MLETASPHRSLHHRLTSNTLSLHTVDALLIMLHPTTSTANCLMSSKPHPLASSFTPSVLPSTWNRCTIPNTQRPEINSFGCPTPDDPPHAAVKWLGDLSSPTLPSPFPPLLLLTHKDWQRSIFNVQRWLLLLLFENHRAISNSF